VPFTVHHLDRDRSSRADRTRTPRARDNVVSRARASAGNCWLLSRSPTIRSQSNASRMPAARGRRSSGVTSYAESPSSDDEPDATTRPAKRARAGDSDNDAGYKKPAKKAKKPARKSRVKPKGTDRFTPLPLDPLLEVSTRDRVRFRFSDHRTDSSRRVPRQILRYVDAVSLIHLRETSRTLYRLLSGPDGAPIWSHALAEEGLPVLKAGLLKPWQYAEIALWKRCTVRRRRTVCSLLAGLRTKRKPLCRAQNCTKTQFIPDFYVLRRYCRVCRKGTLFRLDHLKKNYPDAHPCTKLCVLESHCKSSVWCSPRVSVLTRSTICSQAEPLDGRGSVSCVSCPRYFACRKTLILFTLSHAGHAFRDDFEALDEYLWSLQAQDDADSSLRSAGRQNGTRKTTTKRSPDAPLPGSRVAKFVKERQRVKELVEQVRGTARLTAADYEG
jgi:hypothetical protein